MRFMQKIGVYTRVKTADGWRYQRVQLGRGKKHGDIKGPFYLRPTVEGKRVWQPAKSSTLAEVLQEADTMRHGLNAAERGLTISEFDEISNVHRITIHSATENFLKLKKDKSPSTLKAYSLHLKEFQESLTKQTRYLDDIDADTLRRFKDHMAEKGHSGKTQHNRLLTVTFLLKTNGLKNPLSWKEFPTIEEDPAVPFEPDELKKLFAAMTAEEKLRYNFFLKTGAREKEVSYASWSDLDLGKGIFHIRAKKDVGFSPKSHESRSIPVPASLVAALKSWKEKAPHPRWIFANKDGRPEGHFLKKLKRIAFNAGLNCGHCITETTEMTANQRREAFEKKFGKGKDLLKNWEETDKPYKLKRIVTCADAPVCSHFFLHRFRKTCATLWLDAGLTVRQIQVLLGHKDLSTTQKYLGADTGTTHVREKINAAFSD
jgi:integrase/recombinase XerD